MEELVNTFHIQTNLIIAQLVNFTIVLIVLYMFAYKPILKVLNERTEKIEKGLKDSEDAGKKLTEITEKEKEVLHKAKKEAQKIIKKTEEEARKNAEVLAGETKEKNDKMIAEAKKQIEQEKDKMMTEIRSEVAELVVATTKKIIGEKIDSEKDKELIERSLQ